ncbi:MFS multidrug transporter [Collybia nuda]|uniref:MFS multidrug transporter n=1 Tax=Collybia nuda TaxID=64659 RepID=A0A9P5XYX9_9AGAR|nr:MFS multidrug transporter [Collybia nuda]
MSDTDKTPLSSPQAGGKGFRFWLIFLALCVSLFLSALEFSIVANALPVIINELQGEEFAWVGTAYALAATAFLPFSGVFGRKWSFIGALLVFTLGCALCGAAQSMAWLIAARTVQGIGGGAIQSISTIVVSDLVSLQERGKYNGLLGMTWAVATSVGPLIGGALAQQGRWRWVFYLNLPICGVALGLCVIFMRLPTPPGTLREKVKKMDWIGNFLVVSSTTSLVIALTWGGARYPWSSARVLVPLILGIVGLLAFFIHEMFAATHPMVPRELLSNRTTVSGYVQVFINSLVVVVWVYYLPIYYQGCKGASPTRSSVNMFGITFLTGPFVVLGGATVSIFKRYRPQLWIAWVLAIIGAATLSTYDVETPLARAIGLTVIGAAGAGLLFGATYFPVLSPLHVSQNARALALFAFFRAFAGIWGITIGSAIFTNKLTKHLSPEFLAQFPGGVDIVYSIIPTISSLHEPTRSEVRHAFAESLKPIWYTITALVVFAFLVSLLMADVPLQNVVDKRWALEEKRGNAGESGEKRSEEGTVSA